MFLYVWNGADDIQAAKKRRKRSGASPSGGDGEFDGTYMFVL